MFVGLRGMIPLPCRGDMECLCHRKNALTKREQVQIVCGKMLFLRL